MALWDIRRGKTPVERSVLTNSHGDPAYKVLWVQSKSNTEFFSTSTDGQVLWWDYRKLEEPIEQMWIDPTKKQEKTAAEGGLCLDFEPTMVRTLLLNGFVAISHLEFFFEKQNVVTCRMFVLLLGYIYFFASFTSL